MQAASFPARCSTDGSPMVTVRPQPGDCCAACYSCCSDAGCIFLVQSRSKPLRCGMPAQDGTYVCCAQHAQISGGKGAACDVTFFKRREFCFTLPGDIFARYKSFQVRSPHARSRAVQIAVILMHPSALSADNWQRNGTTPCCACAERPRAAERAQGQGAHQDRHRPRLLAGPRQARRLQGRHVGRRLQAARARARLRYRSH